MILPLFHNGTREWMNDEWVGSKHLTFVWAIADVIP